MSRRDRRVRAFFKDGNGVWWRLYDFRRLDAQVETTALCDPAATHRGFVRDDDRTVARDFRFGTHEEDAAARALNELTLQAQLDRSKRVRRRPPGTTNAAHP